MKKNIFFFLFLFVSCRPTDNPETEKGRSIWVDVKKWNLEILELDSMTINGNIPLRGTKSNLLELLGKPDTIIPIYPNFSNVGKYNFEYKMLYFKNLRYTLINQRVLINSINFEGNNIKLAHPKITLDGNTTIMQLQDIFPESGYLIRGGRSTFTGYMQLRPTKDWTSPTFWLLVFKDTKLIRIDFIEAFP